MYIKGNVVNQLFGLMRHSVNLVEVHLYMNNVGAYKQDIVLGTLISSYLIGFFFPSAIIHIVARGCMISFRRD